MNTFHATNKEVFKMLSGDTFWAWSRPLCRNPGSYTHDAYRTKRRRNPIARECAKKRTPGDASIPPKSPEIKVNTERSRRSTIFRRLSSYDGEILQGGREYKAGWSFQDASCNHRESSSPAQRANRAVSDPCPFPKLRDLPTLAKFLSRLLKITSSKI